MVDYKRLGIATLTGAVLGVACIIGVGRRVPGGYAANIALLMGIWAMRLILGITIGLAGGIIIVKGEKWQYWLNAGIRGVIFGLIFSAAVLLMDPYLTDFAVSIPTFVAGIAYGPIIDLIASAFRKKKTDSN